LKLQTFASFSLIAEGVMTTKDETRTTLIHYFSQSFTLRYSIFFTERQFPVFFVVCLVEEERHIRRIPKQKAAIELAHSFFITIS
jgi:hypothetical protein